MQRVRDGLVEAVEGDAIALKLSGENASVASEVIVTSRGVHACDDHNVNAADDQWSDYGSVEQRRIHGV